VEQRTESLRLRGELGSALLAERNLGFDLVFRKLVQPLLETVTRHFLSSVWEDGLMV
jgi:hypothetical protein